MLLVTGGTGFLGSALVELLRRRGHAVRATVRAPERAALLPPGVEAVLADLADEESLAGAMAGCEGVFHLAASVGHSPAETRRSNVDGTAAVLRAADRAGVARVVHTSSAAAIVDDDGFVGERAPNRTALTDPYSRSKAEAEGLVLAAVDGGLDARIVNVVNAYGPSPRGPLSYNGLFLAAARGEVREIVDARVGWVLAEDVAAGQLLVLEHGEAGHRYVLCGEVAGFAAVLHRFAELSGSPHRAVALPPGATLPDDAPTFARRSEVYGQLGPVRVDDGQARALGFTAAGVEDGLRRTAAWLGGGRGRPPAGQSAPGA